MKKHPDIAFFLSGIVFMALIAVIKYVTKTDIGIVGLLVSFAFGGVVGLLAITEKDTFLKNVVFIGAFAWLIWALLVPIETVGGNWVIKKTELLAIITIVVIFLEQDFLNMIRKMTKKPTRFGVGVVGVLLLGWLLDRLGFWEWLFQYWWVIVVSLLIFWGWLFIRGANFLKKLLNTLTNVLERRGR
jgi:hypothetical protein